MNDSQKQGLTQPKKLVLFDDYNKTQLSLIVNDNKFLLENHTGKEHFNSKLSNYKIIYLPINNLSTINKVENLKEKLLINLKSQYSDKSLHELSFEEFIDFKADDEEKDLLLHMNNETKRIKKIKEAIITNDYQTLTKLINQANYSLKNLVLNLTQRQEQVIIFSYACDSLATKIINLGFIFLVETKKTNQFINKFRKLYNDFYGTNIDLIELITV
ncbi:MAG: hypothetical protein ACOCUD_02780 [Bacillota bacterium]